MVFLIFRMTRLMHSKNSKIQLTINREIKDLFKGPLSDSIAESAPFAKLMKTQTHQSNPSKQYFISCLRHHFSKLLSSIERNLKDNLSYFKKEYIEILSELGLAHSQCYEVLAGKVGDSQKNVGTAAAKYVTLGIMHQPNKALTIVQSVHQKMMKQQDLTGMLPFVVCLANVDFGKVEDKNVLHKCLEIFMGLSKQIVMINTDLKESNIKNKSNKNKKDKKNPQSNNDKEISNKLLRHLTRGVNRILPHLKNFESINNFFETRAETFFKLSHNLPSRSKVQLLIFLFQLASGDMYSSFATRFMNTLYSSLKDSTLMNSSLAEAYFDLLYSALSADHDQKRIMAFVKRIFVRAVHCPARVALTALVFFARLIKEKPILKSFLDFKREGEITQGIEKTKKKKKSLIGFTQIESDVENLDEQEEDFGIIEERQNQTENEQEFHSEVVTKKNIIQKTDSKSKSNQELKKNQNEVSKGFDFNKRNPSYAKANESGLWELFFFAEHYHYLVRKFARMILSGKADEINYKGNPVIDFSLSSIVNRLIVRPIKKVIYYINFFYF